MKTNVVITLMLVAILIASCKKDPAKAPESNITKDQLTNIAAKSPQTFAKIQSFMLGALSKAAQSGVTITEPPSVTSAKIELSKATRLKSTNGPYDWTGPDADGWYTMSYKSYGFTYTNKIRCKDSTLTSIYSIEWSGAEGSYSNVTETQYTKYTKNHKVFWKGFTDYKIKTFGDNDISDAEWKFEFYDWNPQTGAGIYDWYCGAHSLGGSYEPYHRYLNIIATEKGSGAFVGDTNLLHVKVTWYDGSVSVGTFEYDSTWEPVEMPETPCQ